MKQKLNIELYRYDNLVFGKVLEMDEGLRGKGRIWESKDKEFKIMASYGPELDLESLDLAGDDKNYDNAIFHCEFDNKEDAKEICSYIKKGVDEINNESLEKEDFSGIEKVI